MKILHLRTPSIADGPCRTIGPKGLELAFREGATAKRDLHAGAGRASGKGDKRQYTRLFHGPLVQTLETALKFCDGLGYLPTVMPAVVGFNDETVFADIIAREMQTAVNQGLSGLAAIHKIHGDNKILAKSWAELGRKTLKVMFDAMADGEIGIGFFRGATIELTARACGANEKIEQFCYNFGEMEGLIFTSVDGRIEATGKISLKTRAGK